MEAIEAKKLAQESDAAYNKCLEAAFVKIGNTAKEGKYQAWVTLPQSEAQHKRFYEYLKDRGYRILNQQSNTICVDWE